MIPRGPHHLGVPSGASKMISEPMVRLAQNLCTYLTSTLTPSPNGPNEIPRDPHHLGVPSGVIPLDRAGVPDLSVSGG